MKKVIGMILSLAGLALLAIASFPGLESYLSWLPSFIQIKYVMIAALGLVIIGVIFTFDKGGRKKIKQVSEEVPIYEGEGKHRRIVGYRK
jgi:hypothetical protein